MRQPQCPTHPAPGPTSCPTPPGPRAVVALPAVLLLAALTACATPPPPAAADAASHAPATVTGTVLAIRPVPPHTADLRRRVLAAIGAGARPIPAGPAVEVIVRARDGSVLSVIQPRAGGLRPGARVEILPGEVVRAVPLPARS